MLQELDKASRKCGLKMNMIKNKDHGRNHNNNQGSICRWNPTWSNKRVRLPRPTFYINREKLRQRNKKKNQSRKADIWKTQDNHEGYITKITSVSFQQWQKLSAAQHSMER